MAILLGILWVPAVVHCQIEMIAIDHEEATECCDHGTSTGEDTCLSDNCEIFDRGHVRAGDDDCLALAEISLSTVVATIELLDLEPIAPDAPQSANAFHDWTPEWAFERRVAGLSRAPNSLN